MPKTRTPFFTAASVRALPALALCFIGVSALSAAGSPILYVGTYTSKGAKGIYRLPFDAANGRFATPELAAATSDPSFLTAHPSKPVLYAVNEGAQTVSAFSISLASGKLTLLNQQPSGGDGPCHLAVDATGRMLVVANYGGGTFSTYPLDLVGKIGPIVSTVRFSGTGPDKGRQEAPHAHSTVFTHDNRFLFVNDLGTDKIMIYRVHPKAASAEPANPPFALSDPGAGPRHLVIDPKGQFVYVVNEMASTVTRFAFDSATGNLRKMDSVSTLPPGFHGANTTAEIVIAPNGKTLYASNRGHDSIAVFAVAPDGGISLRQNVPSRGKTPRSFSLDPSGKWLIAAHQDSGHITSFSVDPETGALKAAGEPANIPGAVCVFFVTPK